MKSFRFFSGTVIGYLRILILKMICHENQSTFNSDANFGY